MLWKKWCAYSDSRSSCLLRMGTRFNVHEGSRKTSKNKIFVLCVYSLLALLRGSLFVRRWREIENVTVPPKMQNFMPLKSFNVAAVTSDYPYARIHFYPPALRGPRYTMSIYFCRAIYYFYSSSVYISATKREKIAHHTLVSSLINLKRNLFEDKAENRSHTKVMKLHVASWGIHPIS